MSGRSGLCIVIPSLDPGGTERQVLHLVEGLAGEFEVRIVCTRALGAWADRAREFAEVTRLGISSGWDLRLKSALVREFQKHRPEIVQTYLSGFDYAANAAARRTGVRAIVSSRRECATWKRSRHLWLQRRANRLADAIVANSRAAAAFAAEQEREPLERFTIIYNGVAMSAGPSADPRLDLTLPRGAPVIGMVANYSPDKDHALFVAMAGRVRARRPDAHFVLVGDGPVRAATQRSVVSQGMGDSFRFVSTARDATDLYHAMDVCVLTSRVEGMPNVILEAMAAARPVVAAAVGGIPEIIEDRITGRLVATRDPEDFAAAVLDVLADRDAAMRLGVRAAAWVRERFSVAAMVAQHRDLYRRLLDPAWRAR